MIEEKDGIIPGLVLRHYKTKSVYSLRARINKRPTYIRIGDSSLISRAEARKIAKVRRRELDLGESIHLIEARSLTTIEVAYKLAVSTHWSQPRYTESGWAREVDLLYKNHIFQAFGAREISSVKRAEIFEWHKRIACTKLVTANRAMSVLSKIYSIAMNGELCTMNPCANVSLPPERQRSRFASSEEIKKILFLLNTEIQMNPYSALFIMTLLYTGARPRSLERAKWNQVEIVDGYGILRFKGKSTADTGESEEIVIPPQILMLIKERLRAGEFIFNIKTPQRFWKYIANKAGCPDLWARDLRRTFATVALSGGMPLDQIGRMLNHRNPQTTLRYAKLLPDSKIDFARKITSLMDET